MVTSNDQLDLSRYPAMIELFVSEPVEFMSVPVEFMSVRHELDFKRARFMSKLSIPGIKEP